MSGQARVRRDQDGYTLVEVLLAVAIAGIVLVPLMAWTVLVVTQQDDIHNDLGQANSTGFLHSYLSRDVASSKYVAAGGGACSGEAVGARPELQLIPAGVERRVVYVEAPASDPDGSVVTSLWRTQCDAAGVLTDRVEIVRGIRTGSTTVGCYGAAGPGACDQDANRQVELEVVPVRSDGRDGARMGLRVLRRTSSASIGSPAVSNRHPVAQMSISPPIGYGSTSFQLSAESSFDVDGSVAAYDWALPPGATCSPAADGGAVQTCSFASVGDHLIQLTVTDDQGAVNSATGTVTVLNQFPVAAASVSPASGTVGSTEFTFDGTNSVDPDGGPLTYQWDLGDDMGSNRYLSGATPKLTFPADTPAGLRQITLVVADANGDNDAVVVVVDLTGAAGPSSGTRIGDVTVSPALVVTGSGLARLPDPVGPGLADRVVTFSSSAPTPDGSTTTWELRRRGSAEVVATGTGAVFSHTFGPSGAGEYEIVMSNTPLGGSPAASAPGAFRVNAAPVATFTTSGGGAAPRAVSFDGTGSSDAEGSIASFRWSFGFFDQWTSANPSPVWNFADPGTYLISLQVTDGDGATSTSTRSITITGTPRYPTGLNWSGSTLRWSAIPGATSYRVSLVYPCGPVQQTAEAVPDPSMQVAMPSVVCGAPGNVDAYVATESNGVYSAITGPTGTSG